MSDEPQYYRTVEQNRLVWHRRKADAAFWDNHWDKHISAATYEPALSGRLGYCHDLLLKHLPKQGRILEAGCGPGHIVLGLRRLGYDAEGIEFAENTVHRVKELFPDLPVSSGDVTALERPGEFYSAYLSFGVIEHRREGPAPFLGEAWRVLLPGGVAFFSVPYFNILRRLKSLLGCYRARANDHEFYQYAFSRSEISSLISSAGFSIVDYFAYNSMHALDQEFPTLNRLFSLPYFGVRIRNRVANSRSLEQWVGHMLMVVCRKMPTPR